jgi:predicted pyridoxine 5'-phosphate oxidase superfamily flavin-nucleotide-binding protein
MAKLTEEAKKAIAEIKPAYVATAGNNGKPNVSAKGSLRVIDDEHVVFAEIHSPHTLANIKENPRVAIICLDAATRKGVRIWGRAEIISSGLMFEQSAAEVATRNMKLNHLVKVFVEEVQIS